MGRSFSGRYVKDLGLKVMAKMLRRNNTLQSLSISSENLSVEDYGSLQVARMIAVNTALTELSLQNCQ